ncbi:hypothetical protein BDR04DRAFT_1142363 [Suillus decipiens]|nr:hypothetical protein BDR04DRAFT_1142363 [Suillus decipiens]
MKPKKWCMENIVARNVLDQNRRDGDSNREDAVRKDRDSVSSTGRTMKTSSYMPFSGAVFGVQPLLNNISMAAWFELKGRLTGSHPEISYFKLGFYPSDTTNQRKNREAYGGSVRTSKEAPLPRSTPSDPEASEKGSSDEEDNDENDGDESDYRIVINVTDCKDNADLSDLVLAQVTTDLDDTRQADKVLLAQAPVLDFEFKLTHHIPGAIWLSSMVKFDDWCCATLWPLGFKFSGFNVINISRMIPNHNLTSVKRGFSQPLLAYILLLPGILESGLCTILISSSPAQIIQSIYPLLLVLAV